MTEKPNFDAFREEMRRTVYQKKGVSRLPGDETLEYAIQFFKDAGYRSGGGLGKARRPVTGCGNRDGTALGLGNRASANVRATTPEAGCRSRSHRTPAGILRSTLQRRHSTPA